MMRNKPFYKALIGTIVIFVLLIAIGWQAIGWYRSQLLKEYHKRVQQEIMPYGYSLVSAINSRFSLLEGLAAFVYSNPTEDQLRANFDNFAQGLYVGKRGIRALQIFPRSVPEHVYPAKSNEAVIGGSLNNLVNDDRPNVRADVKRTIQTRKMARSVPYRLRQGGLGLVARKAIYHEDVFWGLVTIILDVPPLIEETGLVSLSDSMNLTLQDRTGQIFWKNCNADLNDPVVLPINLMDGAWNLAAEPKEGWMAVIQDQLLIFQIFSIVIIILISSLFYFVVSHQFRLKKQVQERTTSLRKSQELYQKLISQMATGFALYEIVNDETGNISDFRFLAVNSSFEVAIGIDTNVIGRTVLEVLPQTDPTLIAQYKKVADSREHVQIESYYREIDRYFQIVAYSPQKGQLATIYTDITNRKRSEKALLASEEDLKISQRIAHVGSWRLDVSTNQVVWSEELYKMYGFNPALPPPPYTEHQKLFTSESWEKLSTALNKTKEEGIPYELELKTVRKDGSHGWMWVHGEALRDANGAINTLRGAAQDITVRKKAETQQAAIQRELVKRNRFIEMILEFLPIGLGVNYIDSGEVTFLNKKFVEIYGWSKTDFPNVAEFFKKVFPDPIKREILRKKIMGDIASGDPDQMIWEDLEITTNKGAKRIVSAVNIPIFDQNLMISTVQDLTEKRKLEAHIRQTQKMEFIGNLAGGIAHDFNNILSSIIGFTELAIDEAQKDTPLEDNLQEVYAAGKRAKDLVKQILAFARQSEEKRSPIQPSHVANEVIHFIRSTIPTSIEIRTNIQSDSFVMGNATQIHQVLMNLCTNSAHAMEEEDGVLEISLKDVVIEKEVSPLGMRTGDYIEIKVADSGAGISPEIIGSIFEPYFTTKRPGEGTGMGLAMAQGVVNSYGGQITVDSQLGKGTTFTILLPITKERSDHISYEPEQLPTGTERILLVDDDASIAKSGSLILEGLGYSVTNCTSSVEALALFQAKSDDFDLVVTDMTMPILTGDKLAIELMKIRPDIPVILCTGYSKKVSGDAASEIGIKAFAYKPVVKAALAKIVRKVLDEAKSETQA